jgi:gas vesicle protein
MDLSQLAGSGKVPGIGGIAGTSSGLVVADNRNRRVRDRRARDGVLGAG